MVTFVIESDNMQDIDDATSIMSQDDFITELELTETITIDSITPPAETLVTVEVEVDASNIDDVSVAIDEIIHSIELQDSNYAVNGQGIQTQTIFLHFP